ncbi:MAG: arsenate reductase ArsC [Phycisphaerae bacterium]|nr:arsenate reductase ArsC [Phycisphaerae bacterium]
MVKGKDIRHKAGAIGGEGESLPRGVLFLCVHNSARSQMAEGLARAILPSSVAVWSAGSAPAPSVDPRAVRVMDEAGIDIAHQRPKRISDVPLGEIDTIITLCVEEIRVAIPGSVRSATWALPDPAAATGSEQDVLDTFRRVRDELRERIERLGAARTPDGVR